MAALDELLFQEVIVLCCGEILSVLVLLPSLVHRVQYWFEAFLSIAVLCMQFHQLSWLAITWLR